ncbi:MAG: hypothetical protein ACXWC8_21385 [Limisphaerales bacterium]
MKDSATEMNRRTFLKNTLSGAALGFPTLLLGAKTPSRLLAGVSKRCVTPPLFVPYLTSSANGTNAPFTGIHDDLFARALVLDDGHQSLAILSVDSIGFDNSILGHGRNFTDEWRKNIARHTGLKPANIMLAATHTHSAPETIGLTPIRQIPGVAEWLEIYLKTLVETVVDAWRNRVPVRAFSSTKTVPGIERYRRIVLKNGKLSVHGNLPPLDQVQIPWELDETLTSVCFERETGGLHAALLNYTAHPVISMLLPQVSADYPGVATAHVEQQFPNAVCLFTNGAAGNINTVKVSTNFDDVGAIGHKLGSAAIETIAESLGSQPFKEAEMKVRSARIELPPRPCPSVTAAEKSASPTAFNREGTVTRLALKLTEGPPRGEIQAMRLGPLRWISFPGEPFVETGLALKQAGADFVVGYANGYLGYFPIRRAYAEGGYEVMQGAWSRVAPGSAEYLETQAKNLLGRISA